MFFFFVVVVVNFKNLLRCHGSEFPGKGGWQEIIELAAEAANKASLTGLCENLPDVMLAASLWKNQA